MEPPRGGSSGRRTSGRGKGRGGSRLGLKAGSSPASRASPTSSPLPPAPPASISPQASPAPQVPPRAPPPSSISSSPASGPAPTSSPLPPAPPASISPLAPPAPQVAPPPPSIWPSAGTAQGAGLGAMPPFFASGHGQQQDPNSWVYPPGGFMNFVQRPLYQQYGENFHLVGQNMTFNPISPPPPPSAYGAATPQAATNETVNLDPDEDETDRPVKKRYWTHEEEERLANAWLNASKDPVKGNDKKGDTFWKEVTDQFNKNGKSNRIREINQLKVHWSRLKASINDFNGYWSTVTKVNTSGYSDDMLENEAQKMYTAKFGKPFPLVHWWRKLKDEPKWCAQFQETEKNKSDIIDLSDTQSRPIGREAAKAERNGKRKKENIMEGIVILGDNIDKIVKVQQERKVDREKVIEAQIEISNANLKAAKEQKEARMFEVYNSLLTQDTSKMSEIEKANRDKAISKLEDKLFAD